MDSHPAGWGFFLSMKKTAPPHDDGNVLFLNKSFCLSQHADGKKHH